MDESFIMSRFKPLNVFCERQTLGGAGQEMHEDAVARVLKPVGVRIVYARMAEAAEERKARPQ